MRVSVTLHRQEPDHDGNQDFMEPQYSGYNRGYTELVVQKDGVATFGFSGLAFPPIPARDVGEIYTHFSLGDPMNGNIILVGQMNEPIMAPPGSTPKLAAFGGVEAHRLDTIMTRRETDKGNAGAA